MYGVWPSMHVQEQCAQLHPGLELIPALTWKTRIMETKTIPAEQSVGYDRTHHTSRPTRIGLLPIGYDDGYDICFSNRAMVKVHNSYAPVIGRVAMNITTIDLTNIPEAHTGDTVTLIGPEQPIHPATLMQNVHTHNVRNLLVSLASMIQRVVVNKEHKAHNNQCVCGSNNALRKWKTRK